MTPTLVGHAVLGYHLEATKDGRFDSLYNHWLTTSFKKCVVRVNQKEFDKISLLPNVQLFHENNTLGARKSCAIYIADQDIPNVLKFAKLWKPNV
jgi:hypothetical protein